MLKKLILVYCQLMLVCGCSWGQQIFQKRYEISGVTSLYTASTIQITDSSFLNCINYTDSNSQVTNLLCIDTSGNVIWNKTIDFVGRKAVLNIDSTISIIGRGGPNLYDIGFVKIDKLGNVINRFFFGTPHYDIATIISTKDSGNLILGFCNYNFPTTYGPYYGFATKVDKTGTLTWSKLYGGFSNTSINDAVEETNGYTLFGRTTQFSNDTVDFILDDVLILNIDYAGNIISSHAIIEPGIDGGQRIFKKANGNYLLAFASDAFNLGGGTKQMLMEIDSSFTEIWSKQYITNPGIGMSSWQDIRLINDTSIFFYRNFVLLDGTGNLIFKRNPYGLFNNYFTNTYFFNDSFHAFGSTSMGFQYYSCYAKLSNQGISGCYENNNGYLQISPVSFLVQSVSFLDSSVSFPVTFQSTISSVKTITEYTDCIGTVGITDLNFDAENQIEVFPNPFISEFSVLYKKNSNQIIEVRIYNVLGKEIQTLNKVISVNEIKVAVNNMESGVYLLQTTYADKTVTQNKIIKL